MVRGFNRNAKSKLKNIDYLITQLGKMESIETKCVQNRNMFFSLTPDKLSDNDYLLLGRGLKFVPLPTSLQVDDK